jgi:hypothetical protein
LPLEPSEYGLQSTALVKLKASGPINPWQSRIPRNVPTSAAESPKNKGIWVVKESVLMLLVFIGTKRANSNSGQLGGTEHRASALLAKVELGMLR